MDDTIYSWVRHTPSLDTTLRRELLSVYRVPQWVPCLFTRRVCAVKERFHRVPLIVKFADISALGSTDPAEILAVHGGRDCKNLPLIGSAAGEMSVQAIQRLARSPGIERVTLDREVRALLDVAAPTVGAPQVWQGQGTGKGQAIAVIDTGIYQHQDLTKPVNRIIAFKDFVKGKSDPYDDNGHGTHVAGILAGNGTASGGKYRGIAPEAAVVGVKVLDANGSGRISQVIEGIQWVIQNRVLKRDGVGTIGVINLSLGAPADKPYQDDLLCAAVAAAWKAGIVVCAAAGNDGPASTTIGTPAISPVIITVGATDDHGTVDRADDTIAPYSSRGPTNTGDVKPDVVAPGTNIVSLRSSKSTLDKVVGNRVGSRYLTLSGTSMATPVVAGACALILQNRQGISPDGVKEALMKTAGDLNLDQFTQGAGYIRVDQAVL